MTVVVAPPVGLASTMVTVSGKTVPLGDNPTVKISFVVDSRAEHNDKARAVVATAKVDAKGDYTASVRMDQPGVYVVKVTAPDGKGTASSTFTLLDPPDLSEDLNASFDKLYAEGLEKLLASLRSQIAGIPANPARLELEARLEKVETKMKEWPEQSKKLKAAVAKFQEIPKKYPEAGPLLQPRLQRLAEVVGDNKAEQAVIEQELAKSRSASATCEKLEQVIDRAGRDQQSAVRHQFTEYECRVEHQRSFGATAHEADRDRPARAVSDRELSALGSLDQ